MARDRKSDTQKQSADAVFDDAVLADCFACLAEYPALALAVSGGADSTALMLLVKRWLSRNLDHAPRILVLTVDHGLRPKAADEARWVAALAARLGFDHQTLAWRGEKPKTGVQAAARKARYSLMTACCRDHRIPALVTAHHSNDQVETFLMRLQRGSGVDGLASMPPRSRRNGVDLLRPLLLVTREQLRSFLSAQGQDWCEDPSNIDENFERIRLRTALGAANVPGVTPASLWLSAKRLARARTALERTTVEFLKAQLKLDNAGFGSISLAALLGEAEEIGLRALIRMASAFGGRRALRLMKAENTYAKLSSGGSGATLAGCHFGVRNGILTASREYGRMSRIPVPVENGALWDGRFTVSVQTRETTPQDMTLRPLGPDGARLARSAGIEFGAIPRAALLSLPSVWRRDELRHVPFAIGSCQFADQSVSQPEILFANHDILYNTSFSGTNPS
ncbi:MAG: tRNA lysidine(34) synthetase TilS [Hyphomicrobiales bacterium]|nr:tRNA lysidine(34) synthetase TilS [Hyphomicrobiales bacterium]